MSTLVPAIFKMVQRTPYGVDFLGFRQRVLRVVQYHYLSPGVARKECSMHQWYVPSSLRTLTGMVLFTGAEMLLAQEPPTNYRQLE